MDDILACFIVGTVVTWDTWYNEQLHESRIQEVIDLLINTIYFIYIGFQIRTIDFATVGHISRLWYAAIFMIFLRRLPMVLILKKYIPVIKTKKESFFFGWFGPVS